MKRLGCTKTCSQEPQQANNEIASTTFLCKDCTYSLVPLQNTGGTKFHSNIIRAPQKCTIFAVKVMWGCSRMFGYTYEETLPDIAQRSQHPQKIYRQVFYDLGGIKMVFEGL